MRHQSVSLSERRGAWGRGQSSGTQLDMLSPPTSPSGPGDKWPFLQPVGVATHSSFVPVVQGPVVPAMRQEASGRMGCVRRSSLGAGVGEGLRPPGHRTQSVCRAGRVFIPHQAGCAHGPGAGADARPVCRGRGASHTQSWRPVRQVTCARPGVLHSILGLSNGGSYGSKPGWWADTPTPGS